MDERFAGVTRRRFLVGSAASVLATGALVARGEREASARTRIPHVALTWDDGWHTLFRNGLPLFRRHGLPGTLFMVTGETGEYSAADRDRKLTWDEIRQLAASGWEIGSHTRHHQDLPTLSTHDVHRAVFGAKKDLVDKGYAGAGFAYPYNNTSPTAEITVEQFHEYGRAGPAGGPLAAIRTSGRLYTLPGHDMGHKDAAELIHLTDKMCLRYGLDFIWFGHLVRSPSKDRPGKAMSVSPSQLDRFLGWLAQREREGRIQVTSCRRLVRDNLLGA